MLSLLLGFALISDDDPNHQEYDRGNMDITLIVINSLAIILFFFSLCGLIPCVRSRINRRLKRIEERNRIGKSKIIPTTDGSVGGGKPEEYSTEPSEKIRNWKFTDEGPK